MYIDGAIRTYLDDARSDKPTPGGGSISAFAGALGTTMAQMAANFTVGRKKYADREARVRRLLHSIDEAYRRLCELVDEDVRSYGEVSSAYGMPKDTDDRKAARSEAIQKALVVAMRVPREVMENCVRALEAMGELVDLANPNLISDVGVAAILCEAALGAAALNVNINLAGLKDHELVTRESAFVAQARDHARELTGQILAKVEKGIGM